MIDFKKRLKNPVFIITVLIPALFLLAQMLLVFISSHVYPIGFTISDDMVKDFNGIVNFIAVGVLGIGGIVDPTSKGFSDKNEEEK